jgi:sec-independent protein translocase protein TatA
MLGLGPTELILILILVLFFYGAKRFPEIGDGLGKSITAFKKAMGNEPNSGPDRGEGNKRQS